jgi:uncharacterized membrane protein YqgA involved in biofilm formation
MFVGLGTLINIAAILLGTVFGRIFGDALKERTRNLLTDVLGAVTLIGAASAIGSMFNEDFIKVFPTGFPILIVLSSLIFGGVIGSLLRIEERLASLGIFLKEKFAKTRENPNDSRENFVTGFVTASLIFVIGPLAILGSISDGMSAGIDQLLLKSALDFFAAMAFAAAMGWGVAFSALPVGVYQGFWTIIGLVLGSVLNDYQVQAMTATGGVLLLGIALKLLKIKEIAIGDLLPALALAPLIASFATLI